MAVSRDRATAALKKAYALATGVNLRTAQRHYAANHPDWQKFLGVQACAAVNVDKGQPRSIEQVAALSEMSPLVPDEIILPPPTGSGKNSKKDDVLDSDLPEPMKMERVQWELWVESSRAWKTAVAANDPQMSMAYAAITLKAREAYIKAKGARADWEKAERLVLSRAEWNAVHQQFAIPLSNVLSNIATELAPLTNPNDVEFAREKIQEWFFNRLQPRLDQFIEALDAA